MDKACPLMKSEHYNYNSIGGEQILITKVIRFNNCLGEKCMGFDSLTKTCKFLDRGSE